MYTVHVVVCISHTCAELCIHVYTYVAVFVSNVQQDEVLEEEGRLEEEEEKEGKAKQVSAMSCNSTLSCLLICLCSWCWH